MTPLQRLYATAKFYRTASELWAMLLYCSLNGRIEYDSNKGMMENLILNSQAKKALEENFGKEKTARILRKLNKELHDLKK